MLGLVWCYGQGKFRVRVRIRVRVVNMFGVMVTSDRSSIINKIVINIMRIAVIYTAKSQHSFVDSRRRDDTY